jgi:hypothetical protein
MEGREGADNKGELGSLGDDAGRGMISIDCRLRCAGAVLKNCVKRLFMRGKDERLVGLAGDKSIFSLRISGIEEPEKMVAMAPVL